MSTALPPIQTPGAFAITKVDAERLTGGRWIGVSDTVTTNGAVLDSRAVIPGCLFICIKGNRVDGHDFAQRAVADGAALVITSRDLNLSVPQLLVTDAAHAMAMLASEYRRRIVGTTWIAVAGSNGKTTVKELISRGCAQAGPTHWTTGNLNNHLGLPLTVLNTPPNQRFAVIELGANHPGENALLAAIVQPHVAVVTSVGSDHLEGFGSIVGVARASGEVFAALPVGATAVLGTYGLVANCTAFGEDPDACLEELRATADGRVLVELDHHHGVDGEVDAEGVSLVIDDVAIRVALLGDHNLVNVAVAWHALRAAGVPTAAIRQGLTAMQPVSGRLQITKLGKHALIDDSYNANPASMVAALTVLASLSGEHVAVIGHMGELGAHAEAGNRQVGIAAAQHGVALITVGPAARSIGTAYQNTGGEVWDHCDRIEDATAAVRQRLQGAAHTVLVKASRSAGLDQLVHGLLQDSTLC